MREPLRDACAPSGGRDVGATSRRTRRAPATSTSGEHVARAVVRRPSCTPAPRPRAGTSARTCRRRGRAARSRRTRAATPAVSTFERRLRRVRRRTPRRATATRCGACARRARQREVVVRRAAACRTGTMIGSYAQIRGYVPGCCASPSSSAAPPFEWPARERASDRRRGRGGRRHRERVVGEAVPRVVRLVERRRVAVAVAAEVERPDAPARARRAGRRPAPRPGRGSRSGARAAPARRCRPSRARRGRRRTASKRVRSGARHGARASWHRVLSEVEATVEAANARVLRRRSRPATATGDGRRSGARRIRVAASTRSPSWPTAARLGPRRGLRGTRIFANDRVHRSSSLTDERFVHVPGTTAWVTCDENILQAGSSPSKAVSDPRRASRAGGSARDERRSCSTDGRWRMVLHHGSSVGTIVRDTATVDASATRAGVSCLLGGVVLDRLA